MADSKISVIVYISRQLYFSQDQQWFGYLCWLWCL